MELTGSAATACKTLVVVNAPYNEIGRKHEFEHNQVLINQQDGIELEKNLSAFQRELDLHELLQPSKLGPNRHTSQCSIVLLHISTLLVTLSTLEYVVDQKLVRVGHDVFIFKGDPETLKELRKDSRLTDIAFKHFVYDESHQSRNSFINSCQDETEFTDKLLISTEPCVTLVHGKDIVAVALPSPWFKPARRRPSGSYYVMLEEASRRLNFTFSVIPVAGTGRKVDGRWNGAIGKVLYRHAHIALTNAQAESRDFIVDGSGLLCWLDKVFWVRVYKGNSSAEAVFQPFTPILWAIILLSVFAFGTVLFHVRKDPAEVGTGSSLCWAVDLVVRGTFEQGLNLRFTSSRTRYVVILWMIFTYIILTAYRSKLYNVLMFKNLEDVPTNFHQLAFSNYKLFFRSYGGVGEAQLAKSDKVTHRKMVEAGRLEFVNTTEDCVTRVAMEDERSACIDFETFGEYVTASNVTVLTGDAGIFRRSDDADGKFPISWLFRKRSGMVGVFQPFISRVLQSDLLNHWFQEDLARQRRLGARYFQNRGDADYRAKLESIQIDLSSQVKPIPLSALLVLLVLLALGLVSGLVVFSWEIIKKFMADSKDVVRKLVANSDEFPQ